MNWNSEVRTMYGGITGNICFIMNWINIRRQVVTEFEATPERKRDSGSDRNRLRNDHHRLRTRARRTTDSWDFCAANWRSFSTTFWLHKLNTNLHDSRTTPAMLAALACRARTLWRAQTEHWTRTRWVRAPTKIKYRNQRKNSVNTNLTDSVQALFNRQKVMSKWISRSSLLLGTDWPRGASDFHLWAAAGALFSEALQVSNHIIFYLFQPYLSFIRFQLCYVIFVSGGSHNSPNT
jgi:hypothetical protein